MVRVENGFWQEAKDEDSMLMKRLHKFQPHSRRKRQSKNVGKEAVKRRDMRDLEEMFSKHKPMAKNPDGGFIAAAKSKTSHGFASENRNKFQSLSRTKISHRRQSKNGGNEVVKRREMRDLEEKFSKLKPMAKNSDGGFIAAAKSKNSHGFASENRDKAQIKLKAMAVHPSPAARDGGFIASENRNKAQIKEKSGYDPRMKNRANRAQRDDVIRRTVYVGDVDHQITEEQLATLFFSCGQVVDCRVCGDTNSILHFAFVEFAHQDSARAALTLSGTIVGHYPVTVMPSKTAIAPVNPTFLPQTEDECEKCSRTVYVTNIDTKVIEADMKLFFETFCGEVYRLRLLRDRRHSSLIAFVEFAEAESAVAALNCSGVILGLLPIRVSPSKTPIRTRHRRPPIRAYFYS